MVQCSFCSIWYHADCLRKLDVDASDYQNNEEEYLCKKCENFKENVQENLLQIMNGSAKLQELTNFDSTEWKKEFFNSYEDCLMMKKVETRIFEQILLAKVWISLTRQILDNPCSEELLRKHLSMINFTIINVDRVKSKLVNKKK